jgi:hypothetical protein
MEYRHHLQVRRIELKYVISQGRARAIRDFLKGYLEPDPYARAHPHFCYPVQSLYLDTPTLALCRQTRQGVKNRFKLRIRFYDTDPTHPVFLEVKRREADVIRKERAAVTREGASLLLCGGSPGRRHLFSNGDRFAASSALGSFCRLRDEIGASAAAYAAYLREAYVSPQDDRLRITFDRHLRGSPFDPRNPLQPPRATREAGVGGVILEIKFTDCFPGWLSRMAQAFNLRRQSVPKYVHCVKALGLHPGRWLRAKPELVP